MSDVLLYITIALAIARLTLIIVRDDIAEPLRGFVFKHSPPEPDVSGRVHKKAGWWGQVFSCPDCMGVYVATLVLATFSVWPDQVLLGSYVLAASMVTSLIARRY